MTACSTWPPSSGITGRRFSTAQSTLVTRKSSRTVAAGEPGSGGSSLPSAQAAKPKANPASGPATERTTCFPAEGRWGSRGKVTPPNPSSRISGRPPRASPTTACPSSCTSTLTKTTTIQRSSVVQSSMKA